jgi:hypothetical protein
MATAQKRTVVDYVVGVARFDASTFEEIEHDVPSTVWAAVIVLLFGASVGLRALITGEAADLIVLSGFMSSMVASFSLLVFATGAYLTGKYLLNTDSTSVNWPEVFRVLGFAGIPLLTIPWVMLLHPAIGLVPLGWFLVLVVMGLRQALDFDLTRAIMTAALSAVLLIVVLFVTFFALSVLAYVAMYGHL